MGCCASAREDDLLASKEKGTVFLNSTNLATASILDEGHVLDSVGACGASSTASFVDETESPINRKKKVEEMPSRDNERADTRQLRALINPQASEILTESDCQRFLRARVHDIPKAVEMVNHWYEWWETKLPGCELLPRETNQLGDDNEQIYIEHMPHANIGEDKEGSPIYWEKTGLISSRFGDIKQLLTEDQLFVRHVRQQELMIQRTKESSLRHGRNIEKQVIVFDLENLSYKLDTTALSTFKRTLTIDESCYPERLSYMLMINTPFFFTAIWAMIRPWINQETASKIRMYTSSEYKGKLKELIDEKVIPIEYGGSNKDFGWTFPENCDLEELSESNIMEYLAYCI